AAGFISLFGVAIMDGLLMVSNFNALRRMGVPVREAILRGAEKRVRPMTMTGLTAVFGLLPAALSTEIGAQTQQPLAIVVVGGGGGVRPALLARGFGRRWLTLSTAPRAPPAGGGWWQNKKPGERRPRGGAGKTPPRRAAPPPPRRKRQYHYANTR